MQEENPHAGGKWEAMNLLGVALFFSQIYFQWKDQECLRNAIWTGKGESCPLV